MSITVTITAFCEDHPRYQGGGRQGRKETCWGCDDLYNLRHPEDSLLFYAILEKLEVKKNG